MKEQLISFETANLAYNKGFQWPTSGYYNTAESTKVVVCGAFNHNYPVYNRIMVSAPEQTLLQKWLRDVHNLNIRVCSHTISKHFPMIERLEECGARGVGPFYEFIMYETYEDALEAGLQETLKLLPIQEHCKPEGI